MCFRFHFKISFTIPLLSYVESLLLRISNPNFLPVSVFGIHCHWCMISLFRCWQNSHSLFLKSLFCWDCSTFCSYIFFNLIFCIISYLTTFNLLCLISHFLWSSFLGFTFSTTFPVIALVFWSSQLTSSTWFTMGLSSLLFLTDFLLFIFLISVFFSSTVLYISSGSNWHNYCPFMIKLFWFKKLSFVTRGTFFFIHISCIIFL